MAYQTCAVLNAIEQEIGIRLEVLNVDGESTTSSLSYEPDGRAGGVSNSDLMMQIQANVGRLSCLSFVADIHSHL